MNRFDFGWSEWFESCYSESDRLSYAPARITAEYAGCYEAWTEHGKKLLSISGKIRHRSVSADEMPVVGDWVLIPVSHKGNNERIPIHSILKRKTLLARKAAGKRDSIQPIAANADYVFIVQGLDSNFNIKRLDRYLTAVRTSGVNPVIILNKADLCPEKEERKKEAEAAADGVPVLLLDSVNLIGYDRLAEYICPGRTIAFIGSSGAGKSTIINCLGAEKQRTGAVKAKDGKGMHTTTTRRLIRLPGGALLVDTPGMKEFAVWEGGEGIRENFADIEEIALKCRFSNCKHDTEPGCAVKEAVFNGVLNSSRLENYRKIKNEIKRSQKKY